MIKFHRFPLSLILCLVLSVFSSAKAEIAFSKEVSLLAGVSGSQGSGLNRTSEPAFAFFYARSFKEPKPDQFLLRVIADTIVTELKTSTTPLSLLNASEQVTAVQIRFGFSGCYLWGTDWMACLDDGPRLTYLLQGSSNTQTLGSFPLGATAHYGGLFPWIITSRAEYGRWDSREKGLSKSNSQTLFLLGAGYNW
jgi:hypothetical protein